MSWTLAADAPAGHAGLVIQQLAEETWRYCFAEWRVCRGIEGWFDSDGTHLVNITHWRPLPNPPSKEEMQAASNST
jgi:uncharacterized protein DUF551